MNPEKIIQNFKPNTIISKSEYAHAVHQINPKYSERTIYWQLAKLQDRGVLKKVGRNSFLVVDAVKKKSEYIYAYSMELQDIVDKIKHEYPLVDYQVWEFVQLNEFANHQIGKNVFFVEVEHRLEESVFNMLNAYCSRILLCPKEDMFYTYFEENMVVIQRLLSESPKPVADTKGCSLEKLLVDLFSSKLTGQLVERAEYAGIYEEAFRKYYIDEKKMFRYARRRNLEKEIKEFIEKETNIQLLTEG